MRDIRAVMQGPTNGVGAVDERAMLNRMLNRVLDEYLSGNDQANNASAETTARPELTPDLNPDQWRPGNPTDTLLYPNGILGRAGTWHGRTNNNNNRTGSGTGTGTMPGGLL